MTGRKNEWTKKTSAVLLQSFWTKLKLNIGKAVFGDFQPFSHSWVWFVILKRNHGSLRCCLSSINQSPCELHSSDLRNASLPLSYRLAVCIGHVGKLETNQPRLVFLIVTAAASACCSSPWQPSHKLFTLLLQVFVETEKWSSRPPELRRNIDCRWRMETWVTWWVVTGFNFITQYDFFYNIQYLKALPSH